MRPTKSSVNGNARWIWRDSKRRTRMSKRREKTDAKLSRRELIKAGLLSGGSALLASKGIRASAAALQTTQGPLTTPFVEELPIMPEAQPAPGLMGRWLVGDRRTRA